MVQQHHEQANWLPNELETSHTQKKGGLNYYFLYNMKMYYINHDKGIFSTNNTFGAMLVPNASSWTPSIVLLYSWKK